MDTFGWVVQTTNYYINRVKDIPFYSESVADSNGIIILVLCSTNLCRCEILLLKDDRHYSQLSVPVKSSSIIGKTKRCDYLNIFVLKGDNIVISFESADQGE